MQDPYKTLGVAKTASQDEIKKAYRKLARELHPDVNPGDAKIEERFKKVSSAYHLLGDAERRKKFDNGEIDADGRARLAARVAMGADLVLLVIDSDLSRCDQDALITLQACGKPLQLVLNRSDRWSEQELPALLL